MCILKRNITALLFLRALNVGVGVDLNGILMYTHMKPYGGIFRKRLFFFFLKIMSGAGDVISCARHNI